MPTLSRRWLKPAIFFVRHASDWTGISWEAKVSRWMNHPSQREGERMSYRTAAADVIISLGFLAVAGASSFAVLGTPHLAVGAWLASLAVLYARGCERQTPRLQALVIGSTVGFAYAALEVNRLIAKARPFVWDSRLYEFERILGFEPSFSLARFFEAHFWLASVSAAFYLVLPLGVALVYGADRPQTLTWLPRAWLAGALGAGIYWFVPAVGPVHAFPGYPAIGSEPLSTGLVKLGAQAPRNCVPSLHFAWVLLMLFNAKGVVARALAGAFVLFVGLATLGWGEHYLVDLIIAVPFAVGIQHFWARPGLVLVCVLLVALWVGAIVTDHWGLLVHWWAIATTVALPLALACYAPVKLPSSLSGSQPKGTVR